MSRIIIVVAYLLVFVLLPNVANAQQTIRAGQTIKGALETSDYYQKELKLYEDFYVYEGKKGERIRITYEAEKFDDTPLVHVCIGTPPEKLNCYFTAINEVKSRGKLELTLPEDDRYTIQLSSLYFDSTTPYTLSLEQVTPPPDPGPPPSIVADETRVGYLDNSDSQGTHGFYEEWLYQARKGERIRVIVSSKQMFCDAEIGEGRGALFRKITDYLGGGGFLEIEAESDSTLAIHVSCLSNSVSEAIRKGEKVRYKLTVDSLGFADSAANMPLTGTSWTNVVSNEEVTLSVENGNFERLSSGLYRVRFGEDFKKPQTVNGKQFGKIIFLADLECGDGKFFLLSGAAYNGDNLVAFGRVGEMSWTTLAQNQLGSPVIKLACAVAHKVAK